MRVSPGGRLHPLAGALRAIGIDCELDLLLDTRYIGSFEGSGAGELKKAAEDHGVYAVAMRGLSDTTLKSAQHPMLLHVRSPLSDTFDHWILFLGIDDRKARIMDPPTSVESIAIAEILARWDGTALIVSRNLIQTDSIVWAPRLLFIILGLALAIIVAVLHVVSGTGRWSLVCTLARRSRPALTGAQCSIILAGAGIVSIAVQVLDHESILANPEAATAVIAPRYSPPLPNLNVSDVRRLLENGDVVVVDARLPSDFRLGHLPGAINVPVNWSLSQKRRVLADTPTRSRIVVYCQSSQCTFDEKVGSEFVFLGFSNVSLFQGGWVDWQHEEGNENANEP